MAPCGACRLATSEALALDPQSRILLEQAHLALADARPATGNLPDTKTGGLPPLMPPLLVLRLECHAPSSIWGALHMPASACWPLCLCCPCFSLPVLRFSAPLAHASRPPPAHSAPLTGVYVGCMYQEYTQLQHSLGHKISPALITGNGISYLVGRVSYTFGLQGEAGMGLSWCAMGTPHLVGVTGTSWCRVGGLAPRSRTNNPSWFPRPTATGVELLPVSICWHPGEGLVLFPHAQFHQPASSLPS